MNYSEIIEQGIINDNTREHLEQYFTREFNKANSENFIEADEFYNGCLKVLKNWEAHLQEKVYKRKCDLQLMLSTAKENKESFEIYENELKNEREDGIGSETYTINLNRLTNGRLGYNMEFSELLFIKDAINKAYFNTYNFYSVTDLKEVFSDNKLIAVTYSNKDKLRHKFDLKNGNIYHKDSKYLLKVEDRTKLNTSFHLKFERMYILNVSPFLNYQYSKSNNRKELLKYVERAVLNSKMIKHKGVKQEIAEWVQIIKNDKKQEKESTPPPHQEEKLTLKQIALEHFYSNKQITRQNGNKIAKQYGHNSGEKLFQHYTFYSSTANRTAKPNLCTSKKLKNKIMLFESVLDLLPTNKQQRVSDEIQTLKNILETEYQ